MGVSIYVLAETIELLEVQLIELAAAIVDSSASIQPSTSLMKRDKENDFASGGRSLETGRSEDAGREGGRERESRE